MFTWIVAINTFDERKLFIPLVNALAVDIIIQLKLNEDPGISTQITWMIPTIPAMKLV